MFQLIDADSSGEITVHEMHAVVSDLLGIDKATAQDKSGQKGKANYLSHLAKTVGLGKELPDLMHGNNSVRQAGGEPDVFEGIWLPGFGANPYAGTNGRQCDRHAAALFSTKYEEALAALRGMSFNDDKKGVPLEYFVYERVIVDECHVPICLASSQKDHNSSQATNGESKFEKAALSSNRSSCAVRELLGVSVPDTSLRPLRWRKSVWGLTGTPLLTSATRITELAAMCAGAYCCGAANHWRTMERASLRDVFLRYHESVPSRLYTAHCVGAAQGYIKAAVQRNKAEEFEGTKEEVAVAVDVPEAETGEVYGQTWNTLEEHKLELSKQCFEALKIEPPGVRSAVQETVNCLSNCFGAGREGEEGSTDSNGASAVRDLLTQYVKSDVVTICVGLAASMGAFLLGAGTKGKRLALPHSRIMIHQPLGGTAQRQASDIEIEARELLRIKEMLNRSMADMTGQSFEKIEKDTDRDYFLSAEDAKNYGLIDRVIAHPNEA